VGNKICVIVVDFPLVGLDHGKFVISRSLTGANNNTKGGGRPR